MVKKFTLDFLNKICNENGIQLLKHYSKNEVNSQKDIEFICLKCHKNTTKKFTFIIKYDAIYHDCSNIQKIIKYKNTLLAKYGVENVSQLESIKLKKRATTLKNYGVEHNSQSQQIKNKKIATCLKNNGVEYPSQSNEIRNKSKQTCLINYGVEHPTQNDKIMENVSKKCYKEKTFIFPSGKEIKCQGYEPFALKEIIENNIEENTIITGCKNVPTIWYNDDSGKKHKHYVDIFLSFENKCIEVKSTWTIKCKKGNIFEKQKAAKDMGYLYEVWVYDSKGNRVETYL